MKRRADSGPQRVPLTWRTRGQPHPYGHIDPFYSTEGVGYTPPFRTTHQGGEET